MPWIAGCRLLHRDPWVLIVEKPCGLLSQPGLGPAQADSLLSRLQHHEPTLALVHRLDRDTSGLLMLARTSDALSAFSRLFASRRVRKLYVADVCGALQAAVDAWTCRWHGCRPIRRVTGGIPTVGAARRAGGCSRAGDSGCNRSRDDRISSEPIWLHWVVPFRVIRSMPVTTRLRAVACTCMPPLSACAIPSLDNGSAAAVRSPFFPRSPFRPGLIRRDSPCGTQESDRGSDGDACVARPARRSG